MPRLTAATVVACLLVWTIGPGTARGFAGPGRSASAAATATVQGVVWDSTNAPVAKVTTRLRDIQTGGAGETVVTTERGEFRFDTVKSGSYVVEVVAGSGKVIAVGLRFSVEPGETVATFVRLPSERRLLARILFNTATAVIAAASSAGVVAIGSTAPPISPQ